MKKLLTLIFISVFCLNAINAEITWNIEDDGTLTISGTDMPDYGRSPWYSQYSKITKVIIKDGVKNIGSNAFYGLLGVSYFSIPKSVTSIGKSAFYGCDITHITIPNSVTSIGKQAFYGCSGLTNITIPESVTSIDEDAFKRCSGLKKIFNNSSLPLSKGSSDNGYIAYYAIAVYNNVTTEGGSYKICKDNNGNKYVCDFFGSIYERDITLPQDIYGIAEYAFDGCYRLTSINIPNGAKRICCYAFNGCSGLTSVTIPNSITSINNDAFSGCSGLTSITISNSMTSIDSAAFRGCTGLKSITIPNSVTSIGNYAFWGCSALTTVSIPNSVTSIGEYAFYNCKSLTSVTIPNSVTCIDRCAFKNCINLKSVTIPNSVTSIEGGVFYGCSRLTSVTIPNSVSSIGNEAFCGCRLTSVTIPNSVSSIGSSAFYGCGALTSVTIPNSVTSIESYTFYNCDNLTSVTIPNSVISIGSYAFCRCTALTSVTIPNSVTSIGQEAFMKCENLLRVICEAVIPPSCQDDVFDAGTRKSGILHVPASAISAYWAKSVWNEWENIKPIVEPKNITFANANETLIIGTEKTLKATITPEYAIDNTIIWTSTNTDIATVSANGVVTAKSTGTVVITAKTCNGLTAECTVKIIKVPVSSVVLNVSTVSLWIEETKSLTATVTPKKADYTAVEWFSSNTDVATVSPEGIVTAKGKGTCTITCKAADGYGAKSTCSVIVKQPVTAIALSDVDVSLWLGKTKSLTATVTPSTANNTKVEWSSSDIRVASVSSTGMVTAKGKGTCTIICTAADGYGAKKTCSVTVIQPVTSIALNTTSAILKIGETKNLVATTSPTTANNTAVEWSSSDNKVASVSSTGVVTAKGKGTCTITCTAIDGYGAKKTCSVTVVQPVTSIALNATTASLRVGETKNLTATVSPTTANNTKVEWSSSDTKVATVSSTGVVTAKGKGTCTIICTAADGYGTKSTCSITVKQPVTAIALSDATTSLWVGETKTITATVTPTSANNTAVNWSSSDTKVVTVSSDGTITAIGTGSCTITCTAADGYGTKSTCKVIVKQQVNSIDFENETLTIICGTEKILTPTITPSNADVQTLAWKSTDKNIAEITSKGVLKAVSPGTATITCTSTDGFNKQGSIKVNVVSFDITDDKPNIADGTYGIGGITYTRTMKKDNCDVFCMPYDIDLSEYTDFFNKVYVLNGMAIHKSNGKVLIPLKEVTFTETISAGQPFVAYAATSGQVVLKNSSKVTIASLEEPQAIKLDVYDYSGNSVTYNPNIDMTITGNYAKRTGLDKANTFVFSTSGLMSKATTVSPYRFYFTKNDERSSAKITDIQLSFDEDVTGIEELTITNDNKFIYNLKGQRINRADVQKGVYIINGKKKVIK